MGTLVAAIVALVGEVMPYISAGAASAGMIGKIITLLETLVPALVQEASDLVPTVKNFIATLRGASTITKEQLDTLDTIEAKIDADFDAAMAAANAEDAAAKGNLT